MSYTHIRDKTIIPRKTHLCFVCGETIEKGESCVSRTGVDSSEGIFTFYMHDLCEKYADLTFDYYDWEGWEPCEITREEINEEVAKHFAAKTLRSVT